MRRCGWWHGRSHWESHGGMCYPYPHPQSLRHCVEWVGESLMALLQVALVRMCADGARPPAQRFGYNHAFDALVRIAREEGVRTFTRGLGPNVVRSVIMSKCSCPAGADIYKHSSLTISQMSHRLQRMLSLTPVFPRVSSQRVQILRSQASTPVGAFVRAQRWNRHTFPRLVAGRNGCHHSLCACRCVEKQDSECRHRGRS